MSTSVSQRLGDEGLRPAILLVAKVHSILSNRFFKKSDRPVVVESAISHAPLKAVTGYTSMVSRSYRFRTWPQLSCKNLGASADA